MNYYIINILIICIPVFATALITVTLLSKAVLKKNGFKVSFIWMSFSDIKNLKKLSSERVDLKVLYTSLLGSIFTFLSLFVLTILVVVLEILDIA